LVILYKAQMTDSRNPRLRLGTRGSPLALAQAHETQARLCAAHGWTPDAVAIEVIKTTGDQVQDRALAEIGGKGLFTLEIEDALSQGRIDLAVHSMKDVPTELPPGLTIGCLLPREDPFDAYISPVAGDPRDLPLGAKVGSASLRRKAQLLALRPDLDVVTFRGNVGTRLNKLAAGEVAATFLAVAGLKRLKLAEHITRIMPADEMLPAVAQGAIGIETRENDGRVAALLAPLNDPQTQAAVTAERALLRVLDGSCRTPIAALALYRPDGSMSLTGRLASPDGRQLWEVRRDGAAADAARLGREAGLELKALGGHSLHLS